MDGRFHVRDGRQLRRWGRRRRRDYGVEVALALYWLRLGRGFIKGDVISAREMDQLGLDGCFGRGMDYFDVGDDGAVRSVSAFAWDI